MLKFASSQLNVRSLLFTLSPFGPSFPVGPVEIFWWFAWPTFYVIFCVQNLRWRTTFYVAAVSTHLKNLSQIGSVPQTEMKIQTIWSDHLALCFWDERTPDRQRLRLHWDAKMLRLESFSPTTSRHGARSTSPCRRWDPNRFHWSRWPATEEFGDPVGWDGLVWGGKGHGFLPSVFYFLVSGACLQLGQECIPVWGVMNHSERNVVDSVEMCMRGRYAHTHTHIYIYTYMYINQKHIHNMYTHVISQEDTSIDYIS